MLKKILYVILAVTLLSGLVLSVSCGTKEEMPYGEVQKWTNALIDEYKNERNEKVEPWDLNRAAEEGRSIYVLTIVSVYVVNKGAHGMTTFHTACHLNTLNNRNQDSQNIVLKKDEEGELEFRF